MVYLRSHADRPGHHAAGLQNTHVANAADVDQPFRRMVQVSTEDLLQFCKGSGSGVAY
jgi:hypothetical protein